MRRRLLRRARCLQAQGLLTISKGFETFCPIGSPPRPGMYHDPPILAQVGDVMRVEIEKIGVLENPVVAATR